MAGNTQRFDDIVAIEANKQVQGLTADLLKLDKQAVDTAKSINVLNTATANSKTFSDLQRNSAAVEKAQAQAAISQENLTKAIAQREAAELRLATAQQKQTVATEKQSSAAIKASAAYQQLNAAYQETTELARNAGARFGETSQQFQNAARSANFLRERLDAIDKPLGNYQRNVGNYKSAFNGLGNSINQLTRELPAFTFSVQTGFLALSNNIPIFFDEVQRARIEITRLRESGEKVPGLFSQLARSFFSFGTALSIGVTLLTVYGKEIGNFISALFKGKDAMDIFAEKQKSINEVYKNSNQEIGKQVTSLKYLYNAATDVNNAMDKRLLAAKELQKEFPKTFGLQTQENIINGEASGIYQQLTKDIIANARAKAASNKIGSEVAKQLDAEVQIQKIRNAQGNQTLKAIDENVKALVKSGLTLQEARKKVLENQAVVERNFTGGGVVKKSGFSNGLDLINKDANDAVTEQRNIIKRAQINIDAIEKLAGGGTSIGNALAGDGGGGNKAKSAIDEQLKREKLKEDTVLENEESFIERRLMAITKFYENSKAIIDRGVTSGELTQLDAENKLIEIENDVAKDRQKIKQEAVKELVDLEKDYNQQIAQARKDDEKNRKDILDNSKDTFGQGNSNRLLQIEADKDAALNALAEQYEKGLIKTKEYNEQKADIEQQSGIANIESAITLAKNLISVEKELNFDTADDERKLAELQIKLSGAVRDAKIKDMEDEAAERKKLNSKIKELADESANFVVALVDAGFENRKNAIAREGEELTKKTDNEIKQVDKSLLSEQDKSNKINVINAKAQVEREKLAIRQKQVDIEKAKFDKAVAIAKAIEQTAVAVVEALPNIPLAVIVGAIGALQIGAILATPIPEYAKGTDDHKGGLALWGEAGTELATLPSGKQIISTGAEVANFPKHTKITPHMELMQMIRPDAVKYSGGEQVPWREILRELKNNKPQPSKKQPVIVHNYGNFETYRKNYFK